MPQPCYPDKSQNLVFIQLLTHLIQRLVFLTQEWLVLNTIQLLVKCKKYFKPISLYKILSLFWVWMNSQKMINALFQELEKFSDSSLSLSTLQKFLQGILESLCHFKKPLMALKALLVESLTISQKQLFIWLEQSKKPW